MSRRSLPEADLVLTFKDVGKRKGSHWWVYEAASRLGLESHQLLYVGDDTLDWRSAINAAVFYLHAGWAAPQPGGTTALAADTPHDVLMFASHFLMLPPRWEFTLDRPENALCVRSLLQAGKNLKATTPKQFTLQDVFTYKNKVLVDDDNARNLLMLHAISSLYLEGLIPRNPVFAVYPSSKPGKANPVLEEFLGPVSKLFHGYFKDDLLVRAKAAPDTSLLRYKGGNAEFSMQTNTVHVNPTYTSRLENKTVIVVDDFTTTGMSLEWARHLLLAAGAEEVTLLTIGKYLKPHRLYTLQSGAVDALTPFEPTTYAPEEIFDLQKIWMDRHEAAASYISDSFASRVENKPFL
jgi:phosphoribosylpyrophosphate synthetase